MSDKTGFVSRCAWGLAAGGFVSIASPPAAFAGPLDPWADAVVSYDPGASAAPGYKDPAAALGEPARFTGKRFGFPGAVTPFNPVFDDDEIVSLGRGGHLTLRFDEPVHNDPLNPWGIDLLIFGNAGYIDTAFPRGRAGGTFGRGEATLELSPDGQIWTPAPGISIDGLFPTLGYSDLASPYSLLPGLVETDFTRPVRPGYDATGSRFHQIVRAYQGSGGGTGVDIGALGLDTVSFVRISVGPGALGNTEIDAIADVSPVPAPAAMGVLIAAVARLVRRRREDGR